MTADQEKELAALLVKAQAGDGPAYREFLDRAGDYVRQLVARRLKPAQTVDDVVQEVLLSLHSARHTYLPGKPVVPWIRAIAQRRVFDYLRKWMRHSGHKREQTIVVDDFLEMSAAAEATSGLMARDAVASLSEQQRDVFELVKLDGLSTRDVSERLGMSEASVRVSAHRAYEKIKNYLLVSDYENK